MVVQFLCKYKTENIINLYVEEILMNKTTKLFAIALLLVASTSVVKAMAPTATEPTDPTGLPATAKPSLAARSRTAVTGAAGSIRGAVTHSVQTAHEGVHTAADKACNLWFLDGKKKWPARVVIVAAAVGVSYWAMNRLAKRIKARRAKKAAAKAVALDVEDLNLA